ncbi:MAG TPA: hypothetical protein VJR95_11055 [Rhodanobacter sp.]|nr:hypothetical protein [Rhodanobacter sp.]
MRIVTKLKPGYPRSTHSGKSALFALVVLLWWSCRATRGAGFRPGSRYTITSRLTIMIRKFAIASLLVAGVALSGSVLAQQATPAATPTAPQQTTPATAPQTAEPAAENAMTPEHKTTSHHKAKHHKSHKKAAKKSEPASTSTAG